MSSTRSTYAVRARLWKWSGGKGAWFFITLPARVSREIRLVDAGPSRRGFGALRAEATVGESIWLTSIFPSSELNAYLLPVRASVRKAENLVEGKIVSLSLTVHRAG